MFTFKHRFPRITCKDGTTVSLQASTSHYCEPRENDGPYSSIEVGFPSATPPESWSQYADGNFPSDIYGWVPIELVEEYINLHGGVDWSITLDTKDFYEIR